jgi:MFS family permease
MTNTASTADRRIAPAADNQRARKAGIAALIGTMLEWYDFLIYGTAAALILNKLFFPGENALAGTLAVFATYAVGFAARPIGGIVLGNMGDKYGRKRMLQLTLVLMGIATTAIGLLPTYATIGVFAPILLLVLRIVQGFAAGGEYAGAVVLAVEHGNQTRRGAAGAWAPTGYALATLLATGVFQLATLLPDDAFASWGWRVPFLLGAVLLVVGYIIRSRIEETPVFIEAEKLEEAEQIHTGRYPVLAAIKKQPRAFFVIIGTRLAENSFAYLFPVFGVAYATTHLGVDKSWTLLAVVISAAVEVVMVPTWAILSDRIGRRPVYAAGAVASALWLIPFFLLLETRNFGAILVAFVIGFGILYPAMLAPQAAYFAEMFNTKMRMSGFAFSRELGSVLAGGILPFIATAILGWSGHWWAVAAYLGLYTVITLVALAFGPETYKRDIVAAAG